MHEPGWLDECGREFHAKRVFPALVVERVIKPNRSIERCLAHVNLTKPETEWNGRAVVILPVDGGKLVGPAPIAPIGTLPAIPQPQVPVLTGFRKTSNRNRSPIPVFPLVLTTGSAGRNTFLFDNGSTGCNK